MDINEKKVDEHWKENVQKEKEKPDLPETPVTPEPTFSFFVTTLALQASIFLGVLENPASNKKEENLEQAKFIIDTLDMLKEKTTGNLTPEEKNLIENILYELRMTFVSKNKGVQTNDG